jgi:CubicO group peptidase (beta-lactamase class C family)
MGRIGKLVLIVALALASTPVAAQAPEPQPAAPTGAPQAASGLDALVEGVARALQHEHGIPGLTVSVVQGDALVLARGYGLADIKSERPVLPEETLFRIGSVSKTFTWTAVMMLAERGRLDLDADVNLYLRTVRVADAFGAPVTLRHLRHHRGGFEDTLRVFTVRDGDPRSLPELLAEHQPARVFPPGARTSYSNWGAALAAQVVEDASGIPFGDFLRAEILEPLGMADTTWTPPAAMESALAARLATGYRPARGGVEGGDYLQLGAYWPAGGMASTATDMARWMRFHLNGGTLDGTRLMAPETHAAMWTRAYDDRPAAADVAHGFQDRVYRGVRTFAHGGGTATFLTNMVLVPELGVGVFLSQNSAHAYEPIVQVPNRIVDHLAGHGYQAALAAEGATEPLGDLAGTYLGNRRVFTTFAKIVGATSVATVTPVSAETIAVAALGETTLFRRLPDAPDTFEDASGGRIAFLRDGDGRSWRLPTSRASRPTSASAPSARPLRSSPPLAEPRSYLSPRSSAPGNAAGRRAMGRPHPVGGRRRSRPSRSLPPWPCSGWSAASFSLCLT